MPCTMKNTCLLCCLIFFSAIYGQKTNRLGELTGLDKFVMGDDVAKYANTITKTFSKDSAKGLLHYRYTGKDITTFAGLKLKYISLEFCSGKLETVMYQFGMKSTSSQNKMSGAELETLKNKLVQIYGKPRMHNSNNMGPDDKGRGGIDSESWAWTNKNIMLNLMRMKTVYTSGDYVSISVIDNELRKNCKNK